MRKLTSTLALAALVTAGAATAQGLGKSVMPMNPPMKVAQKQQQEPLRVSPNPEKAKGALIYAGQAFSWFEYPSWVKFGSNEPMISMEAVFNFRDDSHANVQRDRVQSMGGLYNPEDGYYYMVRAVVNDTWWATGMMYTVIPDAWMRFRPDATEPENWEVVYDLKTNYSDVMGFSGYFYDPKAPHYQEWTDSYYDYRDKKFRAITKNIPDNEGELVLSDLGTVDKATGIFESEETLTDLYFGMTCDLDGTLYAVRRKVDFDGYCVGTVLVRLDRDNYYDETVLANITDVGKAFKVGYQGNLEFDRNNNHLYFAGYNEDGYFKFFEFDEDFKQVNSEGRGLANHILKGMYAPYVTADTRDAAGRVTAFASSHDATGANSVTLNWANPKRQWNNKELTELAEVLVYRDNLDAPIATVTDVAVGGSSSYTDEGATQGLHRYYLVPCRTAGEKGLRDSLNVFVGRDVPGEPLAVKAVTTDGKSIGLSWSAPVLGAQDGWIDAASLKYNVRRLPDNVKVAENITETSLTDTTLGDAMAYFYEITAVSVDGAGLTATSEPVIAGNAWRAPKFFDFNDEYLRNSFYAWDPQWGTSYGYENQDWAQSWRLNPGKTSDDILSSPKVKLEAGQAYRIIWHVETMDHTALYLVNGGYCVDSDADSREFADEDEEWYAPSTNADDLEFTFTAKETGEYNLFLEIKNGDEGNDYDVIRVKSLNFEEVYPVDLQAVGVSGIQRFSSGQTQPLQVVVRNNGIDNVTGYKVQVLANGKTVIGEGESSAKLRPGEEERLTVSVTAPANDPGQGVDVSARVIAEGDGQAANDESDYAEFLMEPATTAPFNLSSFGKKYYEAGRDDTQKHVPVNMGAANSYCEIIYPAANLTVDPAEDYGNVTRVAFRYFSNLEFTDSLALYMTQTDRTDKFQKDGDGYCSNALGEEDFTLVAEMNYDYKEEFNDMIFNLTTPFKYDPSKSIILAVVRTGSNQYTYPVSWALYDDAWSSKDGWACRGSKVWGESFVHSAMPATFFSVETAGSGVEEFASDSQKWTGEPVYYNLMGQRVSHPAGGIFIEVRGNQVRKVAIK